MLLQGRATGLADGEPLCQNGMQPAFRLLPRLTWGSGWESKAPPDLGQNGKSTTWAIHFSNFLPQVSHFDHNKSSKVFHSLVKTCGTRCCNSAAGAHLQHLWESRAAPDISHISRSRIWAVHFIMVQEFASGVTLQSQQVAEASAIEHYDIWNYCPECKLKNHTISECGGAPAA